MSDFLAHISRWLNTAKDKWNALTLNQKVLISGAVLLVIISAGMLVSSLATIDYEPLYTQLAMEDAAAITKKLDEAKIKYKLADEGSTILVPVGNKYQTRLMLAGEGLPRGTAGFELFQKPQFGETETDKRIKYLTALQGELVRTIQSLDKVDAARVHLVIPEPTLYEEKEEPPTASVMLKVKAGEELTKKEILGIVNLVANSVEGLKAENVVLVDQYSNLLSFDLPSGDALSTAEMSYQQMSIKRQFEREKQQAVQSMLDTILGAGKSVVRVSAELNFDEVEQFSQDFDPDQRVVISKHVLEESSTSTTQEPSGAPGVDSNVPTYQGVEGQTGTSSYEKTENTTNYEGDKVETKTRVAPGAVQRLTVAVLIDEAYTDKKEDIIEAVKNASGIDERRNDRVSVNFIKFQPEMQEIPETAPLNVKSYLKPAGIAGLLLLAILLGLLARNKKRSLREKDRTVDTLIDEEISIESLLERELTPEEKEKQRIRDEIDKLIKEHPEDAAQIIRTWMLDEKG